MKKILTAISVMFFILGFGFAASAIYEIIPSESQIPEPGPNAEKLNEYIIKYDPYMAWELWLNKGKLYKGAAPHGALLTTFVNNAAYFPLERKKA